MESTSLVAAAADVEDAEGFVEADRVAFGSPVDAVAQPLARPLERRLALSPHFEAVLGRVSLEA